MSAESRYWRKTRRMTIALLLLWFGVTLLTCLYAPELNAFRFLGFPVGFYFAAQGSLIVFLLIVGFYAWYMSRLDREAQSSEISDNP
jgi:putative solute:sodium symporter small subunit